MTMTGKDFIDWIQKNQMEEKNIYFLQPTVVSKSLVVGVKEENLIIDECSDLLICPAR